MSGLYTLGTTCATRTIGNTVYSSSYDDWGNMSGRSYSGIASTLNDDALDHLVHWDGHAGTSEDYLYDASGERVLRRAVKSNGKEIFTYPFGLMDIRYSSSGVQVLENDYYTLAGRLIGEQESGVTVFLLTDELGSVITSISAVAGSAAVTSNQAYSPYGTQRYRKGAVPTDKGFTGQYLDDSGLNYYNARYYDPVVGRFVSADIKQGNAQGMDPYSYVGNDPETLNDPTGQRFCSPATGECEKKPCGGNCSPGSGNGGGGSPPPSGCTWNGKPCTKTNNPCIGTVWNGKGCVPGGQSQVDKDRAALDKHYADEKNFTSLIMEAFAVIIGIAEVFSLKGLLMWGVAAVLQAIVALGQAIHFAADIMLMLNHGVVTPTIKSLLGLGLGLSAGGNALNALWIGMGWFASIGGVVVEATLTPELATIVFGSTLVVILAQANLIGMQAYFDTITAQQSAVDNSKNPGFVHAQCVSELGAANC